MPGTVLNDLMHSKTEYNSISSMLYPHFGDEKAGPQIKTQNFQSETFLTLSTVLLI